MLLINAKKKHLLFTSDVLTLGEKNTLITDRAIAFLFSVLPILQHYTGVYVSASWTLLIVILLYGVFKLIRNPIINGRRIGAVIPILLYWIFELLDHGFTTGEAFRIALVLMIFVLICAGCINARYVFSCMLLICLINLACLLVQYFLYYVCSYKLQVVPVEYLRDSSEYWIPRLTSTKLNVYAYRPSAFFLEPSHLFLYSFPVLVFLLLSPHITKRRIVLSVLVSAEIILCLSGMGIGTVIGIWVLFLAFYWNTSKKKQVVLALFKPRNMFIITLLIAGLIVLFNRSTAFQYSVIRIFSNEYNYNAIEGRLQGASVVKNMSFYQWLIGVSDTYSGTGLSMSAFHGTLYKYGLVGIVLSYTYYLRILTTLKRQYFWLVFIIIMMSFFTAHSHGEFYQLYYSLLLLNGYSYQNCQVGRGPPERINNERIINVQTFNKRGRYTYV